MDDNEIGIKIKVDGQEAATGFGQINDAAKNTQSTLGKFPGILGEASSMFGQLSEVTETAAKSTKLFSSALAASGIGLIVVALSSLIEYFRNTTEGADELTSILLSLKEALKPVLDVLMAIGKVLGEVVVVVIKTAILEFNELINAAKTGGVLLKDIFTGQWGKLSDDLKKGADNAIKLAKGFSSTTDEAKKLAQEERELSIAQSEYNVQHAKTNEIVRTALIQARDLTLSHKQRTQALEQAAEAETQDSAAAIKLSQTQLDIEQKKILYLNKGTVAYEDQEKAINNAKAAVINAEAEGEEVQARIQQRNDNQKRQEQEEANKAAEDRQKKIEAREKQIEFLSDLYDKAAEHEGTAEEQATAKITSEYDKRLDEIKKSGLKGEELEKAKVEADKIHLDEMNQLNQKELDDEVKAQQEADRKKLESEKKLRDDTLTADSDKYNQQKANLDLALANNEITAQEYRDQDNKNAFDLFAKQLSTANLTEKQITDIKLKEAKLRLGIIEADKKAALEAEQEKLKASEKSLSQISQALTTLTSAVDEHYKEQESAVKSKYDAEIKAAGNNSAAVLKLKQQEVEQENKLKEAEFNTDKDLKLAQGAITIAQKILEQIPDPIGIALVAAAGAVQIGTILSSKFTPSPVPTKGLGDLLNGPSHAQGGIMINAEGGEAVINKNSTQMYKGMLSAINAAGGGKNFAPDAAKAAIQSNNPPPVKTYVVQTEMASSNEAALKIQRLSRL